jgi:hypothetical protein
MGVNAQTAVPAFTAGQVLTAAEMTEVNTGIPVFATTTTRDAAFGGAGEKVLAEGQFAYIEATNTIQYYDGAAWVNIPVAGLVPIVPTSVAVGSGTATVAANGLITFTTVGTNLSINGCFSSSYSAYKIIYVSANASAAGLTMRLRVSGSDSSATNYWQNAFFSNASVSNAENVYGTSWSLSTTGRANRSFSGDMIDPFKTSGTFLIGSVAEYTAGTNGGIYVAANANTAATSYDGFSIIPGSSTMTGTLSIFGYNQ